MESNHECTGSLQIAHELANSCSTAFGRDNYSECACPFNKKWTTRIAVNIVIGHVARRFRIVYLL